MGWGDEPSNLGPSKQDQDVNGAWQLQYVCGCTWPSLGLNVAPKAVVCHTLLTRHDHHTI